MFETLGAVVGKMNELEALVGRAGVSVDGGRSGVRGGEVVVVLTPNDPAGAVESCKRAADQLCAHLRSFARATLRVVADDAPETPVYEVTA